MDLGLAGRVAVVTGSSQGISRATALLFGSEGAPVAVTCHRERDRARPGDKTRQPLPPGKICGGGTTSPP